MWLGIPLSYAMQGQPVSTLAVGNPLSTKALDRAQICRLHIFPCWKESAAQILGDFVLIPNSNELCDGLLGQAILSQSCSDPVGEFEVRITFRWRRVLVWRPRYGIHVCGSCCPAVRMTLVHSIIC